MSRRISGSPTSFEVTGSERKDQAATVGARAYETALTNATVYKIGLQTSCRKPFLCSRKGLWPW
jgi:hypothetical protein